MAPQLFGARKGFTSQSVSYPVALRLEVASAADQRVCSLFLDRTKCFDRIVRGLPFGLLRETGCPERV
eukprot:13499611-Alexandrium_andersonii.AAC.1